MKKIILLMLLAINTSLSAQTTLIPFGATWKYLDNGSNQGNLWQDVSYNDDSWKSGDGELGYGDGDEQTEVSYGSDAEEKYTTTYFRKAITITDVSQLSDLKLYIKRDDGAVVYINGSEVFRTNMPSGSISYNTLALGGALNDGDPPEEISLEATALTTGTNIIAVEIHQWKLSNSDISFDLELTATANSSGETPPPPPPTTEPPTQPPPTPMPSTDGPATLIRGPYLQMGNETEVTLRWRTDVSTNSTIGVGTAPDSYTYSATNPDQTTEHEVRISGLSPGSKYYYWFGSSTQLLQNSNANYFYTAPTASTTNKMRFAVFGDCGRNENGFQKSTLEAYLNYAGNNTSELMILLGDNAYEDGTDAEYQKHFFNAYGSTILKNHIVFPAPGNHDYLSQSVRTADYFKVFSMPAAGECGGVPSGTKAYYSFNWGNIHFISLDSYGTEEDDQRMYDTLSPQVSWLKKDLEANTREWTIAYWHHPPFTKGSHNSDTNSELIMIRQNFLRILERYGVDMILCGHSHDYERSYLLNNYYGNESDFDLEEHTKSTSSGKYDDSNNSCPYMTTSGHGNKGSVYVVSGSSGADGNIQSGYPHNALPFSIDDGGMFYFEVEDNRLDAKFIRRDGKIDDQFTIMHDVAKTSNLTVSPGSSITLTSSWTGNYNWSTGQTTKDIIVSPTQNTKYKVTDDQNCITDVFNVTIESANSIEPNKEIITSTPAYQVAPTVVKRGQNITIHAGTNKESEAMVIDNNGRLLKSFKFMSTTTLATGNLSAGIYFIKLKNNNLPVQRILITD